MFKSQSLMEIINDLFEDKPRIFKIVIDPTNSKIPVNELVDLINDYGFSTVTGKIIKSHMQFDLTLDSNYTSDLQLVKNKLIKDLDDHGISIIHKV